VFFIIILLKSLLFRIPKALPKENIIEFGCLTLFCEPRINLRNNILISKTYNGWCRRWRWWRWWKVNPPPPPPRIFAKVAARYAPLSLPANLHDLPDNYMKSLPKFTREGI
jgi:hypothetical protein